MTGPLHVSVLGAMLATAFAAAMSSLLLWMLRVPRPVSLEVARAVRSVGAVRAILVPILEEYYSERAVELASRLGKEQKAKILLGYIVEVPRTLSLGVPLPQAEAAGKQALERGKQIVAMHGLETQAEFVRAREASEGIARLARDYDVDLIVLGIAPDSGLVEGSRARLAEWLFRHAPCEVLIDRLAETSVGAARAEEAPRAEGRPPHPAGAGVPAGAGEERRPQTRTGRRSG